MTREAILPEAEHSGVSQPDCEYRVRHCALEDYELPVDLADSIELQSRWYQLLQQHCFPDQQCRVLELTIGGRLVGALPYMTAFASAFYLPYRKREGITGLYTSVFAPVIGDTGHNEREVLARLLIELLREPDWDVIELGPMNVSSSVNVYLQEVCKCLGLLRQCEEQFANWYLTLNSGGYDEYLKERPGQLRSTLKRKRAALEREHESAMEIYQHADELEVAFADYEKVYANSWKNEETSIEFIRALCRWAAEQGWLRLGVLYVDGVPAAAQIWFVLNRQAAIFKLAYDEAFKAASVGSILTSHLMRHVIDIDGVAGVDFGRGDEPYKADWMSGVEPRVATRIFNGKTLRGRLAWLRFEVLPGLRDRFRRGQPVRKG